MKNDQIQYLQKQNRFFLGLLAAHLPIFLVASALFESSWIEALGFWCFAISGPLALSLRSGLEKFTSIAIGISVMMMSAILIHLGHGMIEMHFHVFVSLAFLIIFGNPWVPIAAAATIAVHHIGFWLFIPKSVFNYDASFGIVVIHALFVVFETAILVKLSLMVGRFIEAQSLMSNALKQSISRLNLKAGEILKDTEAQTGITHEAGASLEQTQLVLSRIQTQMKDLKEAIEFTERNTQSVHSESVQGKDKVKELVGMVENLKSSQKYVKSVESVLIEVLQNTKNIHSIVQKTELLSFNASIESARAGEHGRGFSVVADEMGKLARTSGQSAEEIEKLLIEVRDRVGLLGKSVKVQAENGEGTIQSFVSSFESISLQLEKVRESSLKMVQVSEAQEKGIDESSQVLHTMTDRSQRSFKLMEDTGKAVQDLHSEIREVSQVFEETQGILGLKKAS